MSTPIKLTERPTEAELNNIREQILAFHPGAHIVTEYWVGPGSYYTKYNNRAQLHSLLTQLALEGAVKMRPLSQQMTAAERGEISKRSAQNLVIYDAIRLDRPCLPKMPVPKPVAVSAVLPTPSSPPSAVKS